MLLGKPLNNLQVRFMFEFRFWYGFGGCFRKDLRSIMS